MISPAVAMAGEAALILPASLVVAGGLAAIRRWRLAAAWLAALAAAAGLALAAKLLFHACGTTIADYRVVSPSGHVSLTVAFYGGLAVLFGTGRARAVRALLAGGALLLAVAVGISRVRTGAHSPAEVLIGGATGLVGLAIFAVASRGGRPVAVSWPVAGFGAVAIVFLLGGHHFDVESRIGRAALRLAATLDVCSGPARAAAALELPARLR